MCFYLVKKNRNCISNIQHPIPDWDYQAVDLDEKTATVHMLPIPTIFFSGLIVERLPYMPVSIFGNLDQHAIKYCTQSHLRFCKNEKADQLDRKSKRRLIQNA